jgi:hypothetical protein
MSGIIGGIKGSMKKKFVPVAAGDANWNNVSLLLTGDDLVDHSSTPKTITNTGSVSVNNTTKKYGTGSMYFSGSSTGAMTTMLTVPTSSALDIKTGDFTIELWINTTSTQNYSRIFMINSTYTTGSVGLYYDTGTGKLGFFVYDTGVGLASLAAPALNTWHHVAVTRSGNTFTLFLNGELQQTTTNALAMYSTSTPYYTIGNGDASVGGYSPFTGYIDDLRVTKGVARYTSNFTPPTAALPTSAGGSGDANWSSVSLLLTGETTLDSSASPKTATLYGSPVVSTTRSKYGSSSLYFNGTNSYMYYGQSPFTNLTSTSSLFTIEFWFNASQALTINSGVCIIGINSAASGSNILLYGKDIWVSNTTVRTGNTLAVDTWHHVAIVSNGTVLTVFENGTSVYSGAVPTTTLSSCVFALGSEFDGANGTSPGNYYGGYIDDFRISEGVARYTSNFTPPTAALPTPPVLTDPSWSSVALLLKGDGSNGSTTFTDSSSSPKTISLVAGSPSINTSTKKYGTGSIDFSTNTGRIEAPNIDLVGDFTIEFWLLTTSASGTYQVIFSNNSSGSGNFFFFYYNGTSLSLYDGCGFAGGLGLFGAITRNVWSHIALSRQSGVLRAFIDGTVAQTFTTSNTTVSGTKWGIGGYGSGTSNSEPINGYIDDFRITNGVARYTANFTPPSTTFPTA